MRVEATANLLRCLISLRSCRRRRRDLRATDRRPLRRELLLHPRGMLEFRRRTRGHPARRAGSSAVCRPVCVMRLDQAVLSGSLTAPGYARRRRGVRGLQMAFRRRAGSGSIPEKELRRCCWRSARLLDGAAPEAISAFRCHDAEDVDREIAAEPSQRAWSGLGRIFDSDPRRTSRMAAAQNPIPQATDRQSVVRLKDSP